MQRAYRLNLSDPIVAQARDVIRRSGVQELRVFGSFARGEERDDSDVDIIVRFSPKARTFDNLYAVGDALETLFKRKVDLLTEDSLSPYLATSILSEARPVQFFNYLPEAYPRRSSVSC